ncbi:uncharacterized protein HaLaN_22460, partial [Haematococcus lacustris]
LGSELPRARSLCQRQDLCSLASARPYTCVTYLLPCAIVDMPTGPTYSMPQLPSVSLPPETGMLLPNGGSSLGTPALPAPTGPLQRTSLFVSNMPPGAGKLLLYETFAPYGAIHSVEVLEDSSASEGDRKCGLVSFVHADAAARAMAALHKQPPTASGQLLNLEVQTK